MALGVGVAFFSGAKVGELAAGVEPGRGVLGVDLACGAACGRKLAVPERALVPEAELLGVELGELVTGGRVAGLDGEDDDVDFVGVDEEGGVSPGVLARGDPSPLATARAAAASAGLEAPRTGGVLLFTGAGVAIVGPDESAEGAGRTLLDVGEGRDPLEDDELDGVVADRPLLEVEVDGVAEAGAAEIGVTTVRPSLSAGAGPDGADAGRFDAGAGRAADAGAERAAAAGVGRAAGAGRSAGVGRAAGAGRAVAGVAAGGVLVTVGVAAAAGLSGRAPVGRTRVVSSAAASSVPLDVTFVDASVLIGIVPPPGFCRDVLSDRWLLSELTFHLHAQAADEEPSVIPREPLSIGL